MRLGELFLLQHQIGQMQMRSGERIVQLDRAAIARGRLGELAALVEHHAQIRLGRGRVGIELDRPAQLDLGLVQFSLPSQGVAQIAEQFPPDEPARRPAIVLDRFVEPPGSVQRPPARPSSTLRLSSVVSNACCHSVSSSCQ